MFYDVQQLGEFGNGAVNAPPFSLRLAIQSGIGPFSDPYRGRTDFDTITVEKIGAKDAPFPIPVLADTHEDPGSMEPLLHRPEMQLALTRGVGMAERLIPRDAEAPFRVVSDFRPSGDQPQAIEELAEGVLDQDQVGLDLAEAVLRAVVSMGRALGMDATADGVAPVGAGELGQAASAQPRDVRIRLPHL